MVHKLFNHFYFVNQNNFIIMNLINLENYHKIIDFVGFLSCFVVMVACISVLIEVLLRLILYMS